MDSVSLEPLGKYSIYVNVNHTFGTDAVLLADFAGHQKGNVACDLGTGCGIIPLLLHKSGISKEIHGVEIQPLAAEIAEKNVILNKISDDVFIHNGDMKNIKDILPSGKCDLVTCNPPYKAVGRGSQNITESQKIARHEVKCNFSDVVSAAKYLLKFGGRLCVCHRPERLGDIFCEMRNKGIEPKVFREVIQRKGKEAWLVLVEGRMGGNPGLTILPPLFVEEKGQLSDEMMRIYGDYKQGKDRRI